MGVIVLENIDIKERIEYLRKLLNNANYEYYVLDHPT